MIGKNWVLFKPNLMNDTLKETHDDPLLFRLGGTSHIML